MEQCAIRNCKELIEELMKISASSSPSKELHQRCKELEERAKLLLEHIIGLYYTVQEHQQNIDALKREANITAQEHQQQIDALKREANITAQEH